MHQIQVSTEHIHEARQNLLRRFFSEYVKLNTSKEPVRFAKNITSGVFDSCLLANFYRKRNDTTRKDALDEIVTVLLSAFRIPHETADSIYGFLSWDMQNFKDQSRDVSGEAYYVHQLQVTSTIAGYISGLSSKFINDEERQILLYASLSHDTLEEGTNNGHRITEQNLESILTNSIAVDSTKERIIKIVKHLTRTNGGSYRAAIHNISSIEGTRDRTFGYIIKLADRINNLLTLKELTSPGNAQWNTKNVYKAYALLESLQKDIDENRLDKSLLPVIQDMYVDLAYLCNDELKRERKYYVTRAQATAYKAFEQSQGIGQGGAKIPVHVEVRDKPYYKSPKETLTADMIKLRNLGYPHRYSVSEDTIDRNVGGYFNKLKDVINAWFVYQEFEKKEFVQEEYEQGKFDESILLHETYIQMGSPPYKGQDIFEEFSDHYEALIKSKDSRKITPRHFFEGLKHGFSEIYKMKALFKYEVHRGRDGVMPPVLFEELDRKMNEGPEYEEPVGILIDSLFGYAQSHVLSKKLEPVTSYFLRQKAHELKEALQVEG